MISISHWGMFPVEERGSMEWTQSSNVLNIDPSKAGRGTKEALIDLAAAEREVDNRYGPQWREDIRSTYGEALRDKLRTRQ